MLPVCGAAATEESYRGRIVTYIRTNALPIEKFSHQPRVYALAKQIAGDSPHDDDVLFAAAWLHDIGVFVGHRPEDPAALAAWDMLGYAQKKVPELLREFGFPGGKIAAVVDVILTHQPSGDPVRFEGIVLRDADILEQLGATGILRAVCKIGRDTRFAYFREVLSVLRRNAESLPALIRLDAARRLAGPRIEALRDFLQAAEEEKCCDAE